MKKLSPILYLLLVFLFLGSLLKAQNNEVWQPLLLNVNGTNGFDGVDGQYALTTCNNNDIILIELTNHNNYSIKACWKDFVINNADQRLSSNTVQDSILIRPNSSVKGDCSGSPTQLVMKLTDFGILREDFKIFITNDFDFVIIH